MENEIHKKESFENTSNSSKSETSYNDLKDAESKETAKIEAYAKD